MATTKKNSDLVQTMNPRTGKYIKIDRASGQIFQKATKGPYKGIPLAKMKK